MTELDPAPGPDPTPASAAAALPPDPDAYDAVRNVHARARGLSAPYIAGGRDPDPGPALREERYYGRLLIGMVLVLVLGGFVVGILVALATAGT